MDGVRARAGRSTATAIAVSLLVFAPALMPNDSPDLAERSATSRALDPALSSWSAPAAPRQDEDGGTEGVDVPDPLVLGSGEAVDSVQMWESQRRPELLDAFEENVYGQSLPVPAPEDLDFEETGNGSARSTTVTVTGPAGEASFTVRLFVPDGTPKGTFLLIDHRGSVGDDAGSSSGYAPVSTILDAGYAFAALDAGEVAPDEPGRYREGVINAFYPSGTDLPEDAGRTISAWAWGASRALDYLQTVPGIDAANVAVIGHSRGGKAALWAGAQDTRFPVVISNNSGSTGAKLARRDGAGESLAAINEQFPHWFPETYKSYTDDPDSLPVDQHQLLALIAPGRVVIGSASDDGNADPQGEHMSYLAAAPVYELYGLSDTGLSSQSWPPTTDRAFRGPGMSYHLRSGGHGLEDADWNIYLEGDLFRR